MVSAWNVGEIDSMVLPPCHYGFQVYTRELTFDERHSMYQKLFSGFHCTEPTHGNFDGEGIPKRAISLMWNQRSVDTFLGLPFNIASYALLLEIIAKEVNMIPDELIGNLGDTHLYSNHVEQAKEQIGREPMELPRLLLGKGPMEIVDWYNTEFSILIKNLDLHKDTCFELEGYQSHPSIKAKLSN
jgi:thymidylate synthase